ncbi:hypothetical protein CONLIGDRAFT_606829 [Coniochaeta ligniaria NRRL 30616]|uniref:NACHT domain-containing protein n=1 Tax=Coniochaeta ligniaria NRRL 30616 TaxID=1408157 RepID=A0A1J7I570_9PEZI|nr:hypothetical protein CONLIGDRAFT_606829 [Coniochaeta ligniaria NRRL 30616]
MDPLSIAASILAVVQIADRVISLCRFYLELSRDAPSDLRVILIETSALKTILDNIQFLASNGHGPTTLSTLTGKDGPIEGCHKALDQLSGLFSSEYAHDASSNRSKRRKVKATLTTLAWPFKGSRARKLLAEVVQHKTTLNLALTADISLDIKDIKAKASEIQITLTEFQKREVYKWLDDIDPSALHHRACSQYEPGTGDWVLRSSEWKAWISGQKRAIWIHGIPGAGKTVLTSHLIESVKSHCSDGNTTKSRNAYAYYYCYYGHNADEASAFLKWTIRRLCCAADAVPAKLYKLYKHGEGASLMDLLCVLEEILGAFDCVYIVLDAIDESMPRADLLKVLRDLITDPRFWKVRVLATSREYIDIEESMKGISAPISMRNPLLDEDIRLFVQAQLNTHPKLRLWQASVRDEALEALSTKAKGMFRWVVCQIHILQRLKGDRDTITKALASLPRTLDETYERIFLRIPEEARLFVHHALKWIYAHYKLHKDQICLSNLLQAVQRSTSGLDSIGYDYEYNEDLLREFCGCLILVSPEEHHGVRSNSSFQSTNVVSFAHYTVLEFLRSPRIESGSASLFAVHKEIVVLEYAKMVMLEALDTNMKHNEVWDREEIDKYDDDNKIINDMEDDFNLYSIVSAIFAVSLWGQKLSTDANICKLAFAMFDVTNQHFNHFKDAAGKIESVTGIFQDHNIDEFWDLDWERPPENSDIQTLVHLMLSDQSLELARNFMKSTHTENLLQSSFDLKADISFLGRRTVKGTIVELFAVLGQNGWDRLRLLLELAAGQFDPTRILLSSVGFLHKDDQVAYNPYCILTRLLQLGADPNGHGYRICPLQVATSVWDLEGVRLLLEAGADPNNTGDRLGHVWEKGTVLANFNDILDHSPLNIVQTMDSTFKGYEYESRKKEERPKIEALLIQYGAQNFTRSGAELSMPTTGSTSLESLGSHLSS